MAAVLKPGWSRPSTILFATEIPANERAFSFALAQAIEFGAKLILFHAFDTLVATASETSSIRYYDCSEAARLEIEHLQPLAERVRNAGVECEIEVRPGSSADQVLAFLREREIDRIVMGTHSPGPIGKLLVGSVAETVLRTSRAPVFIVGPEVVEDAYHNFSLRTILCAVSLYVSSHVVTCFAAELAAEHNARLILQHVIRPQKRHETLAERTLKQIEAEMIDLIPPELQERIAVLPIVAPGDPTEELLYQERAQQADLMVLGTQSASHFAVAPRQGVVYKVLAHAHCPVMALSPLLLAAGGALTDKVEPHEVFLADVL